MLEGMDQQATAWCARRRVVAGGRLDDGTAAEIAAPIGEQPFFAGDARVWRLGALGTPSRDPGLEQVVIRSIADIEAAAARGVMAR